MCEVSTGVLAADIQWQGWQGEVPKALGDVAAILLRVRSLLCLL